MKDIILIVGLLLVGTMQSYGCNFNGERIKAFSTSFTKGTASFYQIKTSKKSDAKWMLSSCSKSKKKYMQISHGVNHDYIENYSATTALYEDFVPSRCTLRPNPFKSVMPQKDEIKVFKEKYNFINKCFDTFVTATNGEKLTFPDKQIGCKIVRIDKSKIKYTGKLCFFNIKRTYNFLVEMKFKETCKKKSFYRDNNISTQDLVSQVGFNVVDSSDGSGKGIKTVGTTSIRISIDPDPKGMTVSDDYGRANPTFPGTWAIPDIHFGQPRLTSFGGGRKGLFLPFAVDNRCKEICVGGVCSSPCNYTSPVAGEVELFEIPSTTVTVPGDENCYEVEGEGICDLEDEIPPSDDIRLNQKSIKKRATYITSFYNGGAAQGNWQGIVSGNQIDLDGDVEVGKRYRLLVNFRDPKLDYIFLMDRYKSLLGKIPSLREAQNGVITGISTAGTDTLSSIGQMLNSVGSRRLGKGDISPMRAAILKFQSLFSYHSWPIYVDKVCDSTLLKCKKPERRSNLTLSMEFTVGEKGQNGDYTLKNIRVGRKSPVLSNYTKQMNIGDFPVPVCGWSSNAK